MKSEQQSKNRSEKLTESGIGASEEPQNTKEELMTVNHEINSLKEHITEALNYAEVIVASIRTPLLVLDKDLRVKSANRAFYKTFQVKESETKDRLIFDLGDKDWDIPLLRSLLEKVLPEKSSMEDYEVHHIFKSLGDRFMLLNAHEIKTRAGTEKLILLAFEDITKQRQNEHREHHLLSRFQNLIMQAPTPVCIFKGEDMILEVANDSVFKIWNVGKESLGKPYLEIKPEMRDQPFIGYLNDVFRNGVTHYGNAQPAFFVRETGESDNYYFNFVYQPYRETDGVISGVIVMAFDVTQEVLAKKKIEESEKQFRQLAELMPQKIWTADAAGKKNYFNQRWLEYTGMSFEELINLEWQSIIHPEDREQTEKIWRESLLTGKDYEMENRILSKEGKYLWHLSRATALRDLDGKISKWIDANTEIQTQQEKKEMLENSIKESMYELNQANEGLKEKNQALVKMNRELEAFNYLSSHDLQEPLRKIRIFSGRILEKEDQNLSEGGKNYFLHIQHSAARMQALILDLLTFSSVRVVADKFEKLDFHEMVMEVKAEFKTPIKEIQATIEVKASGEIRVIPFQFKQILNNLMSNAIKFSRKGVPLHITMECGPVKPGEALPVKLSALKEYYQIRFTDNGIGFENKFNEKIFDVFQKLHSKDEYTGTGMGLAIVRKIVDNHQGVITATSELNQGTTFNIYIPTT